MLKAQDIVVAFHLLQGEGLSQSEIGEKVGLSQPEISNALRRLKASRLLMSDSRTVIVPHLIELCVHGVKFFFPPELGSRRSGMPTVTLAFPLKGMVMGDELDLVWPMGRGTARANSLQPIHDCVVHAAERDARVYELLVLLDGIRTGKARVREISEELFIERIQKKEIARALG